MDIKQYHLYKSCTITIVCNFTSKVWYVYFTPSTGCIIIEKQCISITPLDNCLPLRSMASRVKHPQQSNMEQKCMGCGNHVFQKFTKVCMVQALKSQL